MDVNVKDLPCNICGNKTLPIFSRNILNKYPIKYFRCVKCDFIQTEFPFWLNEAYNEAITNQDIGLISRNTNYSKITKVFLKGLNFDSNSVFLDYGGGYGMFVRQMRDFGFNFLRYDIYCQNIFAKSFDGDLNTNYKVITAFEVFEHLDDPLTTIKELLPITDVLFFSTELQPEELDKIDEWWYIMEETGQHISLFSKKSLEYLALHFNLYYYTNGKDLHIFSKNKLNKILILFITNKYFRKIGDILLKNKPSLLMDDYYKLK
jgi:hypothetical protein